MSSVTQRPCIPASSKAEIQLAQPTKPSDYSEAVRIVEWLAVIAILAFMGGRTLPRAWEELNTDFPNYYLTARLLHDGDSADRIYEWKWIQRQKDHRNIDQPTVGFVPLTPFSSLVMYPLTYASPLAAKRLWIILNVVLLAAVATLLKSMSGIAWSRTLLLISACLPLYRNILYGQYYILLLLILTLGLWLQVRQKSFAAGTIIGLGAGLKIFPALFLLYFLRKKDWRGTAGVVVGSAATAALTCIAFGIRLNSLYVSQVLPWALRGDAMDPYQLSASSLSALLHRLFIFEPQWNPHPLAHVPAVFALLHPILQLAIFIPAILLATPSDRRPQCLQLEWAAFAVALLAMSTLPASYHFMLLILPIVIYASFLARQHRYSSLGVLLFLYAGICISSWYTVPAHWPVLLQVPRLYLLIALCAFGYWLLAEQRPNAVTPRKDRRLWLSAFACLFLFQVASNLHHQHGLYGNYHWRLPMPARILSATSPISTNHSVLFTAMLPEGYRAANISNGSVSLRAASLDQLAQAASGTQWWIEEAATKSRLVPISPSGPSDLQIDNAESPAISRNGQWLAFIRADHGRGGLWITSLQVSNERTATLLSSPQLDVLEMTFLPDDSLVFSAQGPRGAPELFSNSPQSSLRRLGITEARYPAASPDGRWLAYSHQQHGVWNLWLRDLSTGESRRLTNADCNDLTPAWEQDSRTLIYSSDCGRALWLTALVRRQVINAE